MGKKLEDNIEYRVCTCGCNRPLLRPDRTPDTGSKRFATDACKMRDKRFRDRIRRQREGSFVRLDGKSVLLCGVSETLAFVRKQIEKADDPVRRLKEIHVLETASEQ